MNFDLEKLLVVVRKRSSGIHSKIHGEQHWKCVTWTAYLLLQKLTNADAEVVFLFGLLHDTMREHDGIDPQHGKRAAEFAINLYEDGFLNLGSSQMDLLLEACEKHNHARYSENVTVGICFDADRLNLFRVGMFPDTKYFSTEVGKSLIPQARKFHKQKTEWQKLFDLYTNL